MEFILEALEIIKEKFHEVIIDIIKKKWQILGENMASNAHGTRMMVDKEDNGYTYEVVLYIRIIEEEEEIQTSSYYSQSHWVRAIIETLVKLRNLEEPIVVLSNHGSEINLVSKEL